MRLAIPLGVAAILASGAAAYMLAPERPGASEEGLKPDPNAARPIAARPSVWIEQLTWMEVRDAIRAGKTTVIIPTGGVEQNGPYVVTGKHNVILRATAAAIAGKLGDALVAPIVPFVPEGSIDPPRGHMRYPGTISVEQETFRALLRDIARSLRAHGFRHVVLIGDSGGNAKGMAAVAGELNESWQGSGARAYHVPDYYDWPGRQQWLADRGYKEVEEGLHDELSVEAMMLSVDPTSVRAEERIAAGKFSINGVPLAPAERTAAVGRALVDHIAEQTAASVRTLRAEASQR